MSRWRAAVLGLLVLAIASGPPLSYRAAIYTRCVTNNDSRRATRNRWHYLLKLSPPAANATAAQRQIRQEFLAFIDTTTTESDCSFL